MSERRGTALFNPKGSEAKASAGIDHVVEGCRVLSPTRLTKGCKATGARLLRVAGRHAERSQDQQVHGVTPRAVECDEQGALVKKSKALESGDLQRGR